jgi:uncharacterized protein (DUF58 family)
MKKFLAYSLNILMCLLAIFFIEIRLGAALLFAFIAAPIITGLSSFLFIRKLKIQSSLSAGLVNKNTLVSYNLNISQGICFSFFYIKISLLKPENLSTGFDSEITIFPGKHFHKDLSISYRSNNWGTSYIGIEKFVVYDYFNLFVYELSNTSPLKHKIEIIPDIPNILENTYFKKCLEPSKGDNEDEKYADSFSHMPSPGYGYRKYAPGDPLKSINWKISSKLDEYYVRKNEYLVLSLAQIIILDPTSPKKDALSQQRVIEAVLGTALFMAKRGIEVNIFYYSTGWKSIIIKNYADIGRLQYEFANYSFIVNGKNISPPNNLNSLGAITIFSDNPGQPFLAALLKPSENNNCVYSVISQPSKFAAENTWVVNDDFEFNNLN